MRLAIGNSLRHINIFIFGLEYQFLVISAMGNSSWEQTFLPNGMIWWRNTKVVSLEGGTLLSKSFIVVLDFTAQGRFLIDLIFVFVRLIVFWGWMLHYIVDSLNLRAFISNQRMKATLSLVLKARTSDRGARAPAHDAGNTRDWLAIFIVLNKQIPLYWCVDNSYRTLKARSTIPLQVDQGLDCEHFRDIFKFLFLSPFENHVVLIYFIDIGKVQALIPLDTLIWKLFLNGLGVELVLKGHLILDS